ncbi:hypothetical protein [Aliarcobacter butzleri]|uniref:hypothetical protein n=1 Tax=Aliarcobacter butzleri TaxID=28197 RepID=UPI0026492AC7|nr:hypothetical protein [Aliarcobacter butzleri]
MFKNIFNKSRYMENVNFEIRLIHSEPVDLIEMANSLISLQNIVSSHIGKEHGLKNSKILLKGVKEGSDIYQLALDFGMGVLPFIDGVNTVNETISHIKSYLNIDKKTVDEIKNNRHYNTVSSENIQSFVAPIINNDNNSKIEIKIDGNVNAPIVVFNHSDAKKIFENADYIKRIVSNSESIKEEENKLFEKVLIKMYQMKDTNKKVQDSSYCDDIVKGKAIPTIIENLEDKKDILVNAFNSLFLVDIEVVKADNQIKLYRVLKLHNIVPLDIDE